MCFLFKVKCLPRHDGCLFLHAGVLEPPGVIMDYFTYFGLRFVLRQLIFCEREVMNCFYFIWY
jgi:hypothetical protein